MSSVLGIYLQVKTETWHYRLIETGLLLKPDSPGETLFPDIKLFTRGKVDLVLHLWLGSPMRQHILFVGDETEKAVSYVYTGKVPPYKVSTPAWLEQVVLKFLSPSFSGNIPPELATQNFFKEFLHRLKVSVIQSQESFDALQPMGAPFQDGFAQFTAGDPQMSFVPYSNDVFARYVIPTEYKPATFSDNGEIQISVTAKTFLNNLCNQDPSQFSVLRGFLRNVLTAKEYGKESQTCVWVYGPAGTGKSTWATLFKAMFDPERV